MNNALEVLCLSPQCLMWWVKTTNNSDKLNETTNHTWKKYSYCVRMIFWYENLSSSYSILFTAAASVVVEELEGEEATDALSSSSSSSSSASGGKVGRVILTRRLLLPLPPLLPPADRASPSSPPPNRPPCKTARPIIFTKYCTISSTFLSIIYTIKFTIKYLQFAGVWVVNFTIVQQLFN